MSAVIKTLTPFLDRKILFQALEKIGCHCLIKGEKIITDRSDPRVGFQKFEKDQTGKYVLAAYDYLYKDQSEFILQVEKAYIELGGTLTEERRIQLEKERQEFIEKQKQTIIARAKEHGYSIYEEKVNNKVKLVLVRNTY